MPKFKCLFLGLRCGKKVWFIQDKTTKGNLCLDVGQELFFVNKEYAEKICELLNKEFCERNNIKEK